MGSKEVKEGKPEPGKTVKFLRKFTQEMFVFGPGKDVFTVRQCINVHKLLIVPMHLLTLKLYSRDDGAGLLEQPYAPAALLLIVMHGIYGVFWVVKDIYFPDSSWQTNMSPIGFVLLFVMLAQYYLPMLCLVSEECKVGYRFAVGNEPVILAASVLCYTIGIFYHFGSDLQKHIQLKHERSLITDGLFAHCRNPNYFGEVMIYTGFFLLSGHLFVLWSFSIIWAIVFVPNMLAKEASMSRYSKWKKWKSKSGFFFPYLPALIKDLWRHSFTRIPKPHLD